MVSAYQRSLASAEVKSEGRFAFTLLSLTPMVQNQTDSFPVEKLKEQGNALFAHIKYYIEAIEKYDHSSRTRMASAHHVDPLLYARISSTSGSAYVFFQDLER